MKTMQFSAFFSGIILGGIIGAGITLLFAPQSGEQARDNIKEIGLETRDNLVATVQDLQNKTDSTYRKIVNQAQKIVDQHQPEPLKTKNS